MKYYHVTRKRFRVGQIIGGSYDYKQNYSCERGIYMTNTPHPHYTIYEDFEDGGHVYEVVPLGGKVKRGFCKSEWIALSAEVVKYIGKANGKLGDKATGNKRVPVIKKPYKLYKCTVFYEYYSSFPRGHFHEKVASKKFKTLDNLISFCQTVDYPFIPVYDDYYQSASNKVKRILNKYDILLRSDL